MKFELHCHSFYSKGERIPCEGTASPKQIIMSAKKKALDGIALTDHNTTTGLKSARAEAKKHGIIFIPAIEVNTLSGHVIGLGINENIKRGLSLDETLDKIRAQGAVSVAPHPFDLKGEGIKHDFWKADAVEIFNALNIDKISNFFAMWKAKCPAVCGSDAHTPEMIGFSTVMIDCDTAEVALKKIKKGRVEMEKNYIPLEMIVRWSRERMKRSQQELIKYADKNYFFPKNFVAKALLKRFVNSKSALPWNVLANISLNISRIYGIFKLLTY